MTDLDISLSALGSWRLIHEGRGINLPITPPFDVHSVLLEAGLIEDPYYRSNETKCDWVHESDWLVVCEFSVEDKDVHHGHWTLEIDGLDAIAEVALNGCPIGEAKSSFITHRFCVTELIKNGHQKLELHLRSASKYAVQKAKDHPFEIPYLDFNCRIPHANFLRKAQCDAGWDWNIALMPAGLLGQIRLRRNEIFRFDEVSFRQKHEGNVVTVQASLFGESFGFGDIEAGFEIEGEAPVRLHARLNPGENCIVLEKQLVDPPPWRPACRGGGKLLNAVLSIGEQRINKRLGVRELTLDTSADEIGHRFTFNLNGEALFIKGANWIPADALPSRVSKSKVRILLEDALAAGMNMIRVWGGGRYEPDWFYDLCDEMGILVWQDFMFACNHYPATDSTWLNLVRREAKEQLRRLSSHPCMALWCGDNELVGAISWFEVTKKNRDRYIANYAVLNHTLAETHESEQVDTPFWPSSPSSGFFDFSDGWHNDKSGDMHFWDVWHEAAPFETYRKISPRFCSEFGFQSFPSLKKIKEFTEPSDRNISSAVMETHQRNQGGNARIAETLSRYFRFPERFEDMVFLSQISQALAMKMAVESWRADKPRCMGTLIWQLNDTWPVASWSMLEHGGAWKLVQYFARTFYNNVLITAKPDDQGFVMLKGVNDLCCSIPVSIVLFHRTMDGESQVLGEWQISLPQDRALNIARFEEKKIKQNGWLTIRWCSGDGRFNGENHYFPRPFKTLDLPVAKLKSKKTGEQEWEISTDVPAFFVSTGLGSDRVYSDNGFHLWPGETKRIELLRGQKASDLEAISL